jgi:hypothetical protein
LEEEEPIQEDHSISGLLFIYSFTTILWVNDIGLLLMMRWPGLELAFRWTRVVCLIIMFVSSYWYVMTNRCYPIIRDWIKWLGKNTYEITCQSTPVGILLVHMFIKWVMCIYFTVYPQPWFDEWIPFRTFWIAVGCCILTFICGIQAGSRVK